jgi:hypothetical protein
MLSTTSEVTALHHKGPAITGKQLEAGAIFDLSQIWPG